MKDTEKVQAIVRHILNVQQNCFLLGQRLMDAGEFHLGKELIANGLIHDNSKFYGIEWEHLHAGDSMLPVAAKHHAATNKHHPEAWGGIHNMHRLYIAEMVCDWKARSSEFGTSLREYIENDAMKRYNFTKSDDIYEKIIFFVDMLCEKPFKQVTQVA